MFDLDRLQYISVYDNDYYKLKSTKEKVDKIRTFMLDYKGSIRQCSEETCIPKSTVHMYIHTYIKKYYYEDYLQILQILRFNVQDRRKARKCWKGKPW